MLTSEIKKISKNSKSNFKSLIKCIYIYIYIQMQILESFFFYFIQLLLTGKIFEWWNLKFVKKNIILIKIKILEHYF